MWPDLLQRILQFCVDRMVKDVNQWTTGHRGWEKPATRGAITWLPSPPWYQIFSFFYIVCQIRLFPFLSAGMLYSSVSSSPSRSTRRYLRHFRRSNWSILVPSTVICRYSPTHLSIFVLFPAAQLAPYPLFSVLVERGLCLPTSMATSLLSSLQIFRFDDNAIVAKIGLFSPICQYRHSPNLVNYSFSCLHRHLTSLVNTRSFHNTDILAELIILRPNIGNLMWPLRSNCSLSSNVASRNIYFHYGSIASQTLRYKY